MKSSKYELIYFAFTVVLQSCFGFDNFLYILWIWCTIRDMIYETSAYKSHDIEQ